MSARTSVVGERDILASVNRQTVVYKASQPYRCERSSIHRANNAHLDSPPSSSAQSHLPPKCRIHLYYALPVGYQTGCSFDRPQLVTIE